MLILALMALGTMAASAATKDLVTPASDSRITIIGRTFVSGDDVTFEWTGVYARVAFEGRYIALRASDTKKNYYNVWLDKDTSCEPDKVIAIEGKDSLYVLFDESAIKAKGAHSLVLQKRTEAEQGRTTLHCFVTRGEVLQAQGLKPRLIEFVGDSYTCGYGAENSVRSDPFRPADENSNKTYATIISRYFDADYILVAHSGQGINRNYDDFGRGWTMPDRYNLLYDTEKEGPKWDAQAAPYRPDLTVIYLCTNDFSTGRQPSIKEFRADYIRLLKNIKAAYGEHHKILCIAAPSDELMRDYIKTSMEASGLSEVWYMALCPLGINWDSDLGASWHPNYAGHRKWAHAILPYVATVAGWPLEDKILK